MLGIELKSLCIPAKLFNHRAVACTDGWWWWWLLMMLLLLVVVVCFSALCILGKYFVTEPHLSLHLPFCKEGCVGCFFVCVSREMFAVYFVWKMPCVQSPRLSSLLAASLKSACQAFGRCWWLGKGCMAQCQSECALAVKKLA